MINSEDHAKHPALPFLCIGGPLNGRQQAVRNPAIGSVFAVQQLVGGRMYTHTYELREHPVVKSISAQPIMQWIYLGHDGGINMEDSMQ